MREITVSSQNIFKGRIFDIKRDLVKLPNGVTVHREFIKHDGAVVVLPLLDSKSLVLIKQFRYSTGKSLFEVPAGNIDKGETPRDCARRELQEETGFSAAKLKKILEFYPAPGYSSEKLHLFLATRLTKSEQKTEEDEFIDVKVVSLTRAAELVKRNIIQDAKTLCALLWLFNTRKISVKKTIDKSK